jgi:hypothetical protein
LDAGGTVAADHHQISTNRTTPRGGKGKGRADITLSRI